MLVPLTLYAGIYKESLEHVTMHEALFLFLARRKIF